MKISILFISIFLSWVAFDRNLFRRRGDSYSSNEAEISFDLGSEALRQKKKVLRHNLDVIPPNYRGKKKPVRTKCNHRSTRSMDVRDSDQRKIRRRFNNM